MPDISRRDDKLFIDTWHAMDGSPVRVAKALQISERAVFFRRTNLEARYNIKLPSLNQHEGRGRGDSPKNDYLQRVKIDGFAGRIVVFSDAHYWPGEGPTVAHRALLEVIRDQKPKLVVANGDIFDGARVSRFPRNGWEYQPRMSDELEEVKERMAEIRHAHRGARHIRTIGNHDIRFDRYLSVNASELEGIAGARLSDHLPAWQECLSVFVNSAIVIKHRWHGGMHAAWNNVMKGGLTMVTGHTHALEARPFEDYRGRRYGVQTGSLGDASAAEGAGPQFAYGEDNPSQGRSGFVMLTVLEGGLLLQPEICEVIDGTAWFRGQKVVSERRKVA